MVPKDCTVINNPVGSASASWFEKDNKVLVSMPGVPQDSKFGQICQFDAFRQGCLPRFQLLSEYGFGVMLFLTK